MSAGLEVKGLCGGYGDTQVIFDVDLRLAAGECLGVVGRNGVGKTTLARLIQGGLPPMGGDIMLNSVSVAALRPHRRRRLGLGYLPQSGMVFDDLTVRENLSLSAAHCGPEAYFERFPRLAERLDQPAGTMSGGERKILAFVRTMIEDTSVLVLDEPSEGVQPENIEKMAACMRDRMTNGAAILICEQNLTLLKAVASGFLGLDGGRKRLALGAEEATYETLQGILAV